MSEVKDFSPMQSVAVNARSSLHTHIFLPLSSQLPSKQFLVWQGSVREKKKVRNDNFKSIKDIIIEMMKGFREKQKESEKKTIMNMAFLMIIQPKYI